MTVYSDSKVARSLAVLGALLVVALGMIGIGGAAIVRNCNRKDEDDE